MYRTRCVRVGAFRKDNTSWIVKNQDRFCAAEEKECVCVRESKTQGV